MKTKKVIGIWMDHSTANLMEPINSQFIASTIKSDFSHQEKNSIGKNENLMHNKEQNQQLGYYKKITEAIKSFDEIVLFGPTTAKDELANLLKADHHFECKKIDIKNAEKMTENQQEAFVKDHFKLN